MIRTEGFSREEFVVMKTQVKELLRRDLIPKKLQFMAHSVIKLGEDCLEALADIEFRKKESVLKNGLINQYKDEIEKLRAEVERLGKIADEFESAYPDPFQRVISFLKQYPFADDGKKE